MPLVAGRVSLVTPSTIATARGFLEGVVPLRRRERAREDGTQLPRFLDKPLGRVARREPGRAHLVEPVDAFVGFLDNDREPRDEFEPRPGTTSRVVVAGDAAAGPRQLAHERVGHRIALESAKPLRESNAKRVRTGLKLVGG